jgi:hypothetical protein
MLSFGSERIGGRSRHNVIGLASGEQADDGLDDPILLMFRALAVDDELYWLASRVIHGGDRRLLVAVSACMPRRASN